MKNRTMKQVADPRIPSGNASVASRNGAQAASGQPGSAIETGCHPFMMNPGSAFGGRLPDANLREFFPSLPE